MSHSTSSNRNQDQDVDRSTTSGSSSLDLSELKFAPAPRIRGPAKKQGLTSIAADVSAVSNQMQFLIEQHFESICTAHPKSSDSPANIRKCMFENLLRLSELESKRAEMLQPKVQYNEEALARMTHLEQLRIQLDTRLEHHQRRSTPAIRRQETRSKIDNVDEEINEKLRQVENLRSQRTKLLERLRGEEDEVDRLTSSDAIQMAEIVNEQVAIASSQFKIPAESRNSNVTGPSYLKSDYLVERLEKESQAWRDSLEKSIRDRKSIQDGVVFWRDISQRLRILEATVVKCNTQSEPDDQLLPEPESAKTENLIRDCISWLQEKLEACEQNWHFLKLAIRHEIEGLDRALRALEQDRSDAAGGSEASARRPIT